MPELKDPSFEEITQLFLKKSDLEKKYDSAQSMDDLLQYFSEAIALSAASIMFSLKGPKRGAFILRILNATNQEGYKTYWDRYNRLLSQCLMIVAAELQPFLIKEIGHEDVEEILDSGIIRAAVGLSIRNRLSTNEKETFKKVFFETLSRHLENPFKDRQDQMRRVFEAHGTKPAPEEIAKLVLAMQGSADWIHPWSFIQNWKRLSKNRKKE